MHRTRVRRAFVRSGAAVGWDRHNWPAALIVVADRPAPTRSQAKQLKAKPSQAKQPKAKQSEAKRSRTAPRKETAAKSAGRPARAGAATPAKARAATAAKAARVRERARQPEPVPRQGFESEEDRATGAVQPPGPTELIGAATEILGEVAKAGLAGGERLLKDALSLFSR